MIADYVMFVNVEFRFYIYTVCMEIKTISLSNRNILEIISSDVLIRNTQDALDILGAVNSEYIVMHTHNFEDDFFDLSTKKLGEVLQKFANYHLKLAIVGDFEKYPSKTLKEFMYESNNHRDYLFVNSVDEVIRFWNE